MTHKSFNLEDEKIMLFIYYTTIMPYLLILRSTKFVTSKQSGTLRSFDETSRDGRMFRASLSGFGRARESNLMGSNGGRVKPMT